MLTLSQWFLLLCRQALTELRAALLASKPLRVLLLLLNTALIGSRHLKHLLFICVLRKGVGPPGGSTECHQLREPGQASTNAVTSVQHLLCQSAL